LTVIYYSSKTDQLCQKTEAAAASRGTSKVSREAPKADKVASRVKPKARVHQAAGSKQALSATSNKVRKAARDKEAATRAIARAAAPDSLIYRTKVPDHFKMKSAS
jgi:hypothetical protein